MSTDSHLKEITDFLDSRYSISLDVVMDWMRSKDIETLGAVFAIMTENKHYKRITPLLPEETVYTFCKDYLLRCLVEDKEGEWALSRYAAGDTINRWFKNLWRDKGASRDKICDLKNMLAHIYKSGDQKLRRCIVDSCLEHLFEERDIAEWFADWKNDPVLGTAYKETIEWGKDHWIHGKSV